MSKGGGVLEVVLGQISYLGKGKICLADEGRRKLYKLTIKLASSKTVFKYFFRRL